MNRGTRRQRANFSFSYCWPAGSKLSCRECKVVQRTMRKSCTGPALRAESMHENALMRMRSKMGRSKKKRSRRESRRPQDASTESALSFHLERKKSPRWRTAPGARAFESGSFCSQGKVSESLFGLRPSLFNGRGRQVPFRRPAGPKMQDTGFTTSSTRILD